MDEFQQKLMSNRSTSLLSGKNRLSSLSSSASSSVAGLKGSGLKKRISRLGDKEWENSIWAEERLSAVTKAIDRVYEMSLNEDNTLSMVDRQHATLFYLNQHVYVADMRVSYEILPSINKKVLDLLDD